LATWKPKVREDLAVTILQDEAVVYDTETSDVHHLNLAATIVFRLCDGTLSVREMAAEIADAYGVSAKEVERQVRALLREFTDVRLLDGRVALSGGKRA